MKLKPVRMTKPPRNKIFHSLSANSLKSSLKTPKTAIQMKAPMTDKTSNQLEKLERCAQKRPACHIPAASTISKNRQTSDAMIMTVKAIPLEAPLNQNQALCHQFASGASTLPEVSS